jgi:hypothetical protein
LKVLFFQLDTKILHLTGRTMDTLLLSKETLRDSKCCRLCGFGSQLDNNEVDLDSAEFMPLYDKMEQLQEDNERLDMVVNRYLPLEVSFIEHRNYLSIDFVKQLNLYSPM